MATYEDIQDWVKRNRAYRPKTCWIAHCKELNGLPVQSQRTGARKHPCPSTKQQDITDAFRHFGMI